MTDTTQIGSSRAGSAAEQGSPAQGLSDHSALYSPKVGPTLRKTVDADRLRKARFFKPAPRPVIAPIAPAIELTPESPVVVADPIILPDNLPKPFSLVAKLGIINRIVGRDFGVTSADILGFSRKQRETEPRHIAVYFAITLLKLTYPHAGRRYGNRDHTTAMHSHRKVIRLMAEPDYADRVGRLRADILSKIEAGQ